MSATLALLRTEQDEAKRQLVSGRPRTAGLSARVHFQLQISLEEISCFVKKKQCVDKFLCLEFRRNSKLPESSFCPDGGAAPTRPPRPRRREQGTVPGHSPSRPLPRQQSVEVPGPHTWESCPPPRAYPSQLTPRPPGSGHM